MSHGILMRRDRDSGLRWFKRYTAGWASYSNVAQCSQIKSTNPDCLRRDEDLSKKDQAALLSLTSDLEFVNLLDHFDESVAGLRDGKFAMKPLAVIATRFRKTILVDADVIFL
jgi:hypothetical protein